MWLRFWFSLILFFGNMFENLKVDGCFLSGDKFISNKGCVCSCPPMLTSGFVSHRAPLLVCRHKESVILVRLQKEDNSPTKSVKASNGRLGKENQPSRFVVSLQQGMNRGCSTSSSFFSSSCFCSSSSLARLLGPAMVVMVVPVFLLVNKWKGGGVFSSFVSFFLSSSSSRSFSIIKTQQEAKQLHKYVCKKCGYTIFPARGRENLFFGAPTTLAEPKYPHQESPIKGWRKMTSCVSRFVSRLNGPPTKRGGLVHTQAGTFQCPVCGADKTQFYDGFGDNNDKDY